MKKFIAVIFTMLLLTGCAGLERQVPVSAPQTAPETTEAGGKVIMPLPTYVDLENLGDCTLAVGFTEKTDAYMDDDGRFVIRMDIYDYEKFDLVDMSMLAVGDTMVISGQNVVVETIEDSQGGKLINGGWEEGGYTFFTNEDGVFYSVGANDHLEYYKVGEAVVPVGQEFTLEDTTDPCAQRVVYPGDLIMEAPNSSYVYQPSNTVAMIADGFLQNITVSYMP